MCIYYKFNKIEVLVERLTYLFRFCFTGYFQIVVSPETFWLKDFNLILRSACCFNLKNPPIPHLNYVFVCAITLFGLYHCCQLPGLLLLTKKILDSFLFHCRDIRALRCIRLSFLEIKSSDLDASDSLWPHYGGMHSTSLRLIQPSQQLGIS